MCFLASAQAGQVVATVDDQDKPSVFSVSLLTEVMSGDTTYQIGYPITMPDGSKYYGYFPFSELKWPLDTVLGGVNTKLAFNENWTLNATLKKNMTDPDDNMEDSDWLYTSDRLDVYSESSISSFDATIFETSLAWDFFNQNIFSMFVGLGYLYENFDYTANLITQYSPSGLAGYYTYRGGTVPSIEYEITYHIPYLLFGTTLQFSKDFNFAASLKFSPYTTATDEDNHLLRENGGKISEGDMTGTAFAVDLSGRYNFTRYIWMGLGFNFIRIDVSGDQDQRYADGTLIGTVDMEAESSQYSGYLTLGVDF